MFFVAETIRHLTQEFERIPNERKRILQSIELFVKSKMSNLQTAELVFICTHNSRRSHIAQIWAQTAAAYFSFPDMKVYSGGTEATAFNPRAAEALRRIGFIVEKMSNNSNPRYRIQYSDTFPAFEVFSKKYDDPENPASGFAAIMTCTHADENCPVVMGSTARISLPFDDPKDFDETNMESIKYNERSLEIGREILYVFSQIKR